MTAVGNWISYTAHKHDVHRVDAAGRLLEADLEEVYFYKIAPKQGYAIQRVYTNDARLNETIVARHNGLIQTSVVRINALDRVALFRCYFVKINFLKVRFQQPSSGIHPMDIVLMRRIRDPVPHGGHDLP